jgi:hypothetical protein
VDIGSGAAGVYVVGTSEISPGDDRIVAVRYDVNGNVLNTAEWPATDKPALGFREAVGVQVVETTDTLVVACGTIEGVGGKKDMVVIAYDAYLNLQWSRVYSHTPYEGFTDDDIAVAISATGDFVAVTGRSRSATGDWDYATLILDSATGFDAMTPRRYDNAGQQEAPSDVVIGGDRVHVTGVGNNGAQGGDYLTIVYDIGDGGVVAGWPQYHDRCGDEHARAIAIGRSGDVFVTGESDVGCVIPPPEPPDYDLLTIKYDSNGVLMWSEVYHNLAEVGIDVDVAEEGPADVVYVLGRTGQSVRDLLTIQYTDYGGGAVVRDWFHAYDTGLDDLPAELTARDADSTGVASAYITGFSGTPPFGYDYLTLKYSSSSGAVPVWGILLAGPAGGQDLARGITIRDVAGVTNAFVTGWAFGGSTDDDYMTVRYAEIP